VIKKWINQRLSERTTLDGAILIGAGVAFLIFKPIAALVAYGAIAYGAWTIWKRED
jgi:NO-binding membrane sensor protein with MHYT domain